MAKALSENGFDSEGRKLGEQNGLDIKNLRRFLDFPYRRYKKFLCCLLVNTTDREVVMKINLTKYPSSPSRKRCELDVAYSLGMCSVGAKALSSPPGKYGRKAET